MGRLRADSFPPARYPGYYQEWDAAAPGQVAARHAIG